MQRRAPATLQVAAYPEGASFGHVAAMIRDPNDRASAKRRLLCDSGDTIAETVDQIPMLLDSARL